ncbi:GDSL esterase/lipase-like [Iris pallida]|uniref:GDSL esterase/lipase-like n=1 Tax=Iris pallida TaxID=29817 RepID=A0AAX6FAD3_IRIPA|nr:GDSL esterase/lipase-like [Iris pallida]
MPKEEYFSQALYTFDIGQNDMAAAIDAARLRHVPAESFIPDTMREFTRVVKSVYEAGGRYFWIHNTGPLGCLPYILLAVKLAPSELDPVGCGAPYNRLAQRFNEMLNETVVGLRRDLPLGRFTYVDIYSAKYMLLSQAEKFGFEHPLETCCGYGGGTYNFDFDVRCGATSDVNGTEVLLGKPCANPSKRIVWDGVHYTEAANRWVFDRIAAGEFSDPPNSPSTACQGKSA